MGKSTNAAALGHLCLCLIAGGCSNQNHLLKINPKIKNHIELIRKDQDFQKSDLGVIWEQDGFKLGVDKVFPKNRKYLVMVSYKIGGSLESMLAGSPIDSETFMTWQPESSPIGYAFVAVNDPGALHGLAAAAHKDSYPVCGGLQLLNLNHMKITQKFMGPYYSELLALPEVSQAFSDSSIPDLESTIKSLEKLGTRFHSSTVGASVPQILADDFKQTAGSLGGFKVELQTISVAETPQKSVVVSLPGQTEDDATIVLGAHLDSINNSGTTQLAPGADDDASGIATVKEILRIISKNNFKFHRRVEIHAYGAEEVGLFGSSSIAQNFAKNNRKVVGMMQFDMNAWAQVSGKKVYLVKNDTSDSLRKGTRDLMHTYFAGDFEEASLSGGTSDHKSWTVAGYPAVFPFENPLAYNRSLHTTQDTSSQINNLPLTERMVHLGLSFLAHYAGLTSSETSAPSTAAKLRQTLSRDLKIAVIPTKLTNQFDVTVATVKDLKSVELCSTITPGGLECRDDRVVLIPSKTTAERSFFGTSTPIEIKAGQRFSLFGLNQNGKSVYLRSVQFQGG